MKIKLNNARLSFPSLFKAEEYEGKYNYKASLLIAPGSENDKTIRAAIEAVGTEAWKAKAAAILKSALAGGSQQVCYYDGNLKEYDGYENMMVLSAVRAEAKGRPMVLDADKSPLAEADGKPYAGCYVNASVELWAQDNKFGKTVRCTLLGVQFAKDGDAFSAGSQASEEDFDTIEAGADAEALV